MARPRNRRTDRLGHRLVSGPKQETLMSWIAELLFILLKSFLYRRAVDRMEQKGILLYLKTLQAVRRSLAGVIAFFCVLHLMAIGLVGTIVAGVFLYPTEPETKLWIL